MTYERKSDAILGGLLVLLFVVLTCTSALDFLRSQATRSERARATALLEHHAVYRTR